MEAATLSQTFNRILGLHLIENEQLLEDFQHDTIKAIFYENIWVYVSGWTKREGLVSGRHRGGHGNGLDERNKKQN